MDDLFHLILINLYERNSLHQDQNIHDFLLGWLGENTNNVNSYEFIITTIQWLQRYEYVHPVEAKTKPLNQWDERTFENTSNGRVIVRLLLKGHNYIEERIRSRNQEVFLKRQTLANEETSIQNRLVGQSVITTNTIQRNLGYRTLWVAIGSMGLLAVYTYFTSLSVSSKDIQKLDSTLKRQGILLQQIEQSQKEIGASLHSMAKDSVKQTLKK
ncbi:MAG: hypothetical protein JST58_05770 [Bacteroidetes bacterium]|nr:hypothetical protein [Bacteroidota bacterium]